MDKRLSTPILLICFNRPTHVSKVLERILEAHPSSVYFFADHWRNSVPGEKEKCEAVRAVLGTAFSKHEDITFHTYFPQENLGCGKGPAAAISWFFANEEKGIILEDDCVPHQDFFFFCEDLLARYAGNDRVGFIGGCNFQDGCQRGDGSYYFSMGHHGTWGWASWRRVWQHFDYNLDSISCEDFKMIINKYGTEPRFVEYWEDIFDRTKKDRMNDSAWDYQFYFSCWRRAQLAVIPNVNLVSNLGDGIDATHTKGSSLLLHSEVKGILPLVHPREIKQNLQADMYFHRTYVQPYEYGWTGMKRFPYRLNKRLKKILSHKGPWIKRNNR